MNMIIELTEISRSGNSKHVIRCRIPYENSLEEEFYEVLQRAVKKRYGKRYYFIKSHETTNGSFRNQNTQYGDVCYKFREVHNVHKNVSINWRHG